MPQLHLFYPENDLALSHGGAHYTPPAAARRLRASGMTLPLWYGQAGDLVCTNGVNAAWLERMTDTFGLQTRLFDHCWHQALQPEPWGWSPASRHLLQQQGVPVPALPDDARIEAVRQLSHRRSAIRLHQLMTPQLDFAIAPAAEEVTDPGRLRQLLGSGQSLMAKLPWSSSGRGLCDSSRCTPEDFSRIAGGMIAHQGAVMIEPLHERLIDFAMLFDCHDGRAVFIGYSVFDTEGLGKYTGNVVASDEYLCSIICRHIPRHRLEAVRLAAGEALGHITAGIYDGPAGIDMFIARTPDGPLLDATVEINFRHTMGMVATRLYSLHMAPDHIGRFSVVLTTRMSQPDTAAVTENGRLLSGTVALTPPGLPFTFILQV